MPRKKRKLTYLERHEVMQGDVEKIVKRWRRLGASAHEIEQRLEAAALDTKEVNHERRSK